MSDREYVIRWMRRIARVQMRECGECPPREWRFPW